MNIKYAPLMGYSVSSPPYGTLKNKIVGVLNYVRDPVLGEDVKALELHQALLKEAQENAETSRCTRENRNIRDQFQQQTGQEVFPLRPPEL